MNFPKQIQQHKNESDSFAIILYKLRELGIFRNVTSQDYGIDFEIEVVEEERVERFRELQEMMERYRRKNQYE